MGGDSVVVNLLFDVLPIVCGVLFLSLFWYVLFCVLSSFAIILKRKRKLVDLLLLSYRCLVTVNVMWLFLMVPWVGLRCVIVVFPDHTHLHRKNSAWLTDHLDRAIVVDWDVKRQAFS